MTQLTQDPAVLLMRLHRSTMRAGPAALRQSSGFLLDTC